MFKKLNKKGFTLAELLVVVAIIGVLVAISIPIFTGQLKKARLATNQANARAAYACATTEYMLKYKDDAPKTDTVSYTYDNSKGTATLDDPAATSGQITETDISKWTFDTTKSGETALGDATAIKWVVVLNKDGSVKGYTATWK